MIPTMPNAIGLKYGTILDSLSALDRDLSWKKDIPTYMTWARFLQFVGLQLRAASVAIIPNSASV